MTISPFTSLLDLARHLHLSYYTVRKYAMHLYPVSCEEGFVSSSQAERIKQYAARMATHAERLTSESPQAMIHNEMEALCH